VVGADAVEGRGAAGTVGVTVGVQGGDGVGVQGGDDVGVQGGDDVGSQLTCWVTWHTVEPTARAYGVPWMFLALPWVPWRRTRATVVIRR